MVTAIAIIAGGIIYLGLRPLVTSVRRLQAEAAQTKKHAADLAARMQTLKKLSEQSGEIEELYARSSAYLPTTVASSSLLVDIAAMAGQSGTKVPSVSFQPAEAQKGGAIAKYPITMTVEGGFENIKTMLRFLNENLRFTTWNTVSLLLQGEQVTLQLNGTIFSKPEVASFADTSLVIDEGAKQLLRTRKIFGQEIDPKGPGRPDPFAGI